VQERSLGTEVSAHYITFDYHLSDYSRYRVVNGDLEQSLLGALGILALWRSGKQWVAHGEASG